MRPCPPPQPAACPLLCVSRKNSRNPARRPRHREGGFLSSPDSPRPGQDQQLQLELQGIHVLPTHPEVKSLLQDTDVDAACVVQSPGPV